MNKYKFTDLTPDRYDKTEYIVYSQDWGIYTKKEAEIICSFLRNNAHKLIDNILKDETPIQLMDRYRREQGEI